MYVAHRCLSDFDDETDLPSPNAEEPSKSADAAPNAIVQAIPTIPQANGHNSSKQREATASFPSLPRIMLSSDETLSKEGSPLERFRWSPASTFGNKDRNLPSLCDLQLEPLYASAFNKQKLRCELIFLSRPVLRPPLYRKGEGMRFAPYPNRSPISLLESRAFSNGGTPLQQNRPHSSPPYDLEMRRSQTFRSPTDIPSSMNSISSSRADLDSSSGR